MSHDLPIPPLLPPSLPPPEYHICDCIFNEIHADLYILGYGTLAVSLLSTWIIWQSGHLLSKAKDDGATSLRCDSGSSRLFSYLVVMITQAFQHRHAPEPVDAPHHKGIGQNIATATKQTAEGAIRAGQGIKGWSVELGQYPVTVALRGMLSTWRVALRLASLSFTRPGAYRPPIHEEATKVLAELADASIFAALEAAAADPENDWPRAKNLLETVHKMMDAALDSLREELRENHRIHVPQLASEALHAALRVDGLSYTISAQLAGRMPVVIDTFTHDKLERCVDAVYERLRREFIDGRDGTRTSASEPAMQTAPPSRTRLAVVLIPLLDDIVDFDVLRPLRKWWRALLIAFLVWCLIPISLIFFAENYVRIEVKGARPPEKLQMPGKIWIELELHEIIALRIVMLFLFLLVIFAQIYLTARYLKVRAHFIVRKLLTAIRKTLVKLLDRPDVITLLTDMCDAGIVEAMLELKPLDGPVQWAYRKWGGTPKLIELIQTAYRVKAAPEIRDVLDGCRPAELHFFPCGCHRSHNRRPCCTLACLFPCWSEPPELSARSVSVEFQSASDMEAGALELSSLPDDGELEEAPGSRKRLHEEKVTLGEHLTRDLQKAGAISQDVLGKALHLIYIRDRRAANTIIEHSRRRSELAELS